MLQPLLTRVTCVASLLACFAAAVWGAEIGLDPPSDHWVYQLPHEQQTRLVSITVSAFDDEGQPVGNADLQAYCEPWDYVIRDRIGESGQIRLRGPVGDWTFFVGADRGPGKAVLAGRGIVKVRQDCEVEVGAERVVELSYGRVVGRSGRGPRARTETEGLPGGSLSFMPTCRPAPLTGFNVGRLSEGPPEDRGRLRLSVTTGIEGYLCLKQSPTEDCPGHMLFDKCVTGQSGPVAGREEALGHVTLGFTGYRRMADVDVAMQPIDEAFCEGNAVHTGIRVPPEGGQYVFGVTPGEYCVWVAMTCDGKYCGNYTEFRLQLTQDSNQIVHLGSHFTASPLVREWSNGRLSAWFDITDEFGNYLLNYLEPTSLALSQNGMPVFNSQIRPQGQRIFDVERSWGPKQSRGPVTYTFRTESDLLGSIAATGLMPEDAWSPRGRPPTYETPHIRIVYREANVQIPAQVRATDLETALTWLFDHYAGAVHPFNGPQWEITDIQPLGSGVAGGDGIGLGVYTPYDPCGIIGPDMVYHEFGHFYENSPPHHPVKVLDEARGGTFLNGHASIENESMASMTGAYCIRAVFGERGYRWTTQASSGPFFDLLTGRRRDLDDHDRYVFLYHYLNDCFGQAINRDFVRAMHGSEGNIERIVASDRALQTFHEMMAAIYSYLAGENLAWLWRWAGYPVADEKMDQAMAYFTDQGASLPEKQ